jgi:hypothetical protein
VSRAYCLSCNELLDVTPGGTCPVGHPLGGDISSPEPWVGFAAARVNGERAAMNGHASPAVDVTALQEAPPRIPAVETFHEPAAPPFAQGDDLARLLAEALEESAPAFGPEASGPGEPAPSEEPPASWDDLASLAAELKFEAEPVAAWEAPTLPEPMPELPEPMPEPEVTPEPAADLMDLSALEDALAAFEEPAPTPVDVAPRSFAPAPVDVPLEPPPPPPVADLPPPVVPVVAPDPVGSAPLTAEVADDLDPETIWADLEEPAPPAAAPRIDPVNFTAKGSRVGDGQARKRRWKR